MAPSDAVGKTMLQEAALHLPPGTSSSASAGAENSAPATSPNVAAAKASPLQKAGARTQPNGRVDAAEVVEEQEDGDTDAESVSDQLKFLAAMMNQTGLSE